MGFTVTSETVEEQIPEKGPDCPPSSTLMNELHFVSFMLFCSILCSVCWTQEFCSEINLKNHFLIQNANRNLARRQGEIGSRKVFPSPALLSSVECWLPFTARAGSEQDGAGTPCGESTGSQALDGREAPGRHFSSVPVRGNCGLQQPLLFFCRFGSFCKEELMGIVSTLSPVELEHLWGAAVCPSPPTPATTNCRETPRISLPSSHSFCKKL